MTAQEKAKMMYDAVVDNWMPELTPCELRLLFFIIRRTIAMSPSRKTVAASMKEFAVGSTRQKTRGTRMTPATASKGIQMLTRKGLITATLPTDHSRAGPSTYSVVEDVLFQR